MTLKKLLKKNRNLVTGVAILVLGVLFVIVSLQVVQSSQNLGSRAAGNRSIPNNKNQLTRPAMSPKPSPQATSQPFVSAVPRATVYPVPKVTPKPGTKPVLPVEPTSAPVLPLDCREDINEDGKINVSDFDILKADYGKAGADIKNPRSDIKPDGVVNLTDFSLLASKYGKYCW